MFGNSVLNKQKRNVKIIVKYHNKPGIIIDIRLYICIIKLSFDGMAWRISFNEPLSFISFNLRTISLMVVEVIDNVLITRLIVIPICLNTSIYGCK